MAGLYVSQLHREICQFEKELCCSVSLIQSYRKTGQTLLKLSTTTKETDLLHLSLHFFLQQEVKRMLTQTCSPNFNAHPPTNEIVYLEK